MAAPEKADKRRDKVCACAALQGSAERRKTVSDSTDTRKNTAGMGSGMYCAKRARGACRSKGCAQERQQEEVDEPYPRH